jgi:hypothetical protein
MHEGLALRAARAVNHLRATLLAGFTTVRDLGTEGAAYADVELKQAVAQGIVPGPRVLAATRVIVATGSYAPKGFALEWRVPQGAEEADGVDSLIRVVRDQIGQAPIGSNSRQTWGPPDASHVLPDEMKRLPSSAHAGSVPYTPARRGMRRPYRLPKPSSTATAARPKSQLMAERRVAPRSHARRRLTPPRNSHGRKVGAGRRGIARKRASFKAALAAGVTILSGSDVGCSHGEMRASSSHGRLRKTRPDALKRHLGGRQVPHMNLGQVKSGMFADLIAVQDDPSRTSRPARRDVRQEGRGSLQTVATPGSARRIKCQRGEILPEL